MPGCEKRELTKPKRTKTNNRPRGSNCPWPQVPAPRCARGASRPPPRRTRHPGGERTEPADTRTARRQRVGRSQASQASRAMGATQRTWFKEVCIGAVSQGATNNRSSVVCHESSRTPAPLPRHTFASPPRHRAPSPPRKRRKFGHGPAAIGHRDSAIGHRLRKILPRFLPGEVPRLRGGGGVGHGAWGAWGAGPRDAYPAAPTTNQNHPSSPPQATPPTAPANPPHSPGRRRQPPFLLHPGSTKPDSRPSRTTFHRSSRVHASIRPPSALRGARAKSFCSATKLLWSAHEVLCSATKLLCSAHELLCSAHELLCSAPKLLCSAHELLWSATKLLCRTPEPLCASPKPKHAPKEITTEAPRHRGRMEGS